MKALFNKITVLFLAVTMFISASLITATPVMAATNPTVTLKAVSNLSSDNAQINASIKNPSKLKIAKVGFVLYDAGGKKITEKYDNFNKTTASFNAWFDMNKYYGKLKAGTTYKYKIYVTVSSKTYSTSLASFTTQKQIPISTKISNFASDARWKNGLSWPQRNPKLSTWSSKGCCAYAADFSKYVYGINWPTQSSRFKKYTGVNSIQTGDIIHTSGHWFVVLKRVGGKLYTAEGAYSNKTRVSLSNPGYYIENGKLYMSVYNSSKTTLKYKTVSFQYGYHYN